MLMATIAEAACIVRARVRDRWRSLGHRTYIIFILCYIEIVISKLTRGKHTEQICIPCDETFAGTSE